METLQADDYQRVRIPDAEPGQVYAYELSADGGAITLTPLKKIESRVITERLVRRQGKLMLDVPKGLELAPGPIPREVPK